MNASEKALASLRAFAADVAELIKKHGVKHHAFVAAIDVDGEPLRVVAGEYGALATPLLTDAADKAIERAAAHQTVNGVH